MAANEVRQAVANALYAPTAETAEDVRNWEAELEQAKKAFEDFHKYALEANQRYLDDDKSADNQFMTPRRLPLFHSNVTTIMSNLYAKIPKAEADRRFFDPADDVARVAAEMMSRVINNDLNDPSDNSKDVLKDILQDNRIGGLGLARFRYKPKFEPNPEYNPEVPVEGVEAERKVSECCEPVYTYWKDVLWAPCRVWSECRWVAFRSYMTKEQVAERFGEEIAGLIPYARKGDQAVTGTNDVEVVRTVPEAEIWEIWDKEKQQTLWYVKGYSQFLDVEDNMLGIKEFLPTPRPFAENITTTKFIPRPDYALHKHLYAEIDELETRIAFLTRACKAVGVYDSTAKEMARILQESTENEMIPIDNFAMFTQQGGLKGVMEWIPTESLARALEICVQQQQLRINQLFQVTGMSDIVRGQATDTGATATEQKIKAQFASTRIQSVQERFAEYVTDLMNIKVSLIRKHYDPETIIKLSNIMATPDKDLVPQAIALIKDPEQFNIRVAIRSESMAQENLASIREERTALIQGMAQFFGMVQPYAQGMPESMPFFMKLLQFSIAGFKGANQMEGVIDQTIESINKSLEAKKQQPPQPTPEQEKVQGQLKIEQMKAQADMQGKQVDAQLDGQKMQMDMQMAQQEFRLEMQKMQAELQMDREKHQLEMQKLQAQIQAQQMQATIKAQSDRQNAEIKAESAQQTADIKAESAAEMGAVKIAQAKAMPQRPQGGSKE